MLTFIGVTFSQVRDLYLVEESTLPLFTKGRKYTVYHVEAYITWLGEQDV